jgi:serine phosphatase RsbU (regulator of sigma subunit)
MKQSSIFTQLIYNIVLPVVVALVLLGVINFRNTRVMLREQREIRNFLISDELIQVLKFQDITLSMLEEKLNKQLEDISNEAVIKHLVSTKSIEKYDLAKLRESLGLEPTLYDFYLIDKNGYVVNTTFLPDLGRNFFDFGEEHKNLILSIFEGGEFVSERFTIESSTRRLKKYTYQPTLNGEYILELGVYSPAADDVINIIKGILEESGKKHSTIVSAELFMNSDDPFSLTKTDTIDEVEQMFLKERFLKRDSVTVERKLNKRYLSFQYLYTESEGSKLYKGSVIRIISDTTNERSSEYRRLFGFLGLFLGVLSVIMYLIYRKTRIITDPIKKLVEHVNRISEGNLSERAQVEGSREIATLSLRFNKMIAELEELYNDLDKKVKERTAEVVAQKEEIESQRDALERQRDLLAEQQKHILDSIHYSKRLQNAILPTADFVKELFPESFIFYLPRNIISGDFYWFHRIGNRKYFSAIDCTGHGVPGALVSMVGQNWLNYAIKDLQLQKPGEILDALNNGVTSTFKEKDDEASVKDGMDLALCCVDYDTMKLEYSGAYNPAIVIRNGEVINLKPDKQPIGASSKADKTNFNNFEMDVFPNDMVYVFSDGYPDQFGGPTGFKFLIKRFRELLLEIHQLPMDEQKMILETTLYDWMGAEDQVDDITVIGIKV